MSVVEISFIGLAATLGLMILLWLTSLALRNASIVDSFWGTGFIMLAPQRLPVRKLPGAALARSEDRGSRSTAVAEPCN